MGSDATGSGDEGDISNNDCDDGRAKSECFRSQLALDLEEINRETIWWQGMLDALVERVAPGRDARHHPLHFPWLRTSKARAPLKPHDFRHITFDPAFIYN